MKYFILIGFVAIVASLGAAMFYMLKNGKNDLEVSKVDPINMARSLAFRVGASPAPPAGQRERTERW